MNKQILVIITLFAICNCAWYDYTVAWKDGVCPTGQEQSPIDLVMDQVTESKGYHEWTKSMHADQLGVSWEVVDHSKFNLENMANNSQRVTTKRDGKEYSWSLYNVHFHTPAEHLLDGKQYPLEIHFIHTLDAVNTQNPYSYEGREFLVFGVFFEEVVDEEQDDLLNNHEFFTDKTFTLKNLDKWLNPENTHYIYKGGLTTPGCDQVVNWVVMERPVPIGSTLLGKIETTTYDLYPNGNARRVQEVLERSVWRVKGDDSDCIKSKNFVSLCTGVESFLTRLGFILAGIFYFLF